jgi:hypothetical protein
MHLWPLVTAVGLIASFAAGAAVVYKWTDANGVVHYSDQPVPGAEKIVTSSNASNGVVAGSGRGLSPPAQPQAPAARIPYRDFLITAPAKEQVFFGDEVVPVRLQLSPALLPRQHIVWKLNGSPVTDQQPDTLAFALTGLPRGTYSISATVSDSDTGDSKTTDPVTFYVREPSSLAPLNPLHHK